MLTILRSIIDSVFPPRESERLIRDIDEIQMKLFYTFSTYQGYGYMMSYEQPAVRALIKENKYHQNARAAKLLGIALEEWLSLREDRIIFLPIPLGSTRQRERGYNQVTAVLRALSKQKPISYDTTILSRNKETMTQTDLKKPERIRNVRRAFSCKQASLQKYQNTTLVIIDDVVTTGATLEAARASLAPHVHPTCKITCLALAH